MPISHEQFLDIADDSVSKPGEAWVRNAVSRAYYAMFHSALRLTNGAIPKKNSDGEALKGGTHERFAEYLCNGDAAKDFSLDDVKTKEIGLALRTAHHKRCNADYKLERKINRIDAVTNIRDARDIDDTVSQLLNAKKIVV